MSGVLKPRSVSIERLRPAFDTLEAFVEKGQLPCAATLIAQHGVVLHSSFAGQKDIERGEPLTEDTIYRIFSMTKPVTAAAMMILYDQGAWRPEDAISKHLPEFAGVLGPGGSPLAEPPTLRHLLTHTAGFGYAIGYGPFDETDEAYLAVGIWDAPDLTDFSRRVSSVPLAYEPGAAWRYSLSMDLQGALIERVTGRSLPDFMRDEIFRPLGMPDTDFYVPENKRERLAQIYHLMHVDQLTRFEFPGLLPDPAGIPPIPLGGGGLFSTLSDYARFAQMLLNRGELDGVRTLSPEAVALMTTNHLPQSIIARGVDAQFQRIGPGRGYGFNGAVFYDAALAGASVGTGTYQWDGASGAWFWIDPENDLLFVGMTQRIMDETMPPLQRLTQDAVGVALS